MPFKVCFRLYEGGNGVGGGDNVERDPSIPQLNTTITTVARRKDEMKYKVTCNCL